MFTYVLIYDCFVILNNFRMFFVFRLSPPFIPIVSAMPSFVFKSLFMFLVFRLRPLFFWSWFSAMLFSVMPTFLLKSFSAMPFVRLCPLFFWSRFRLCLFPAMPAIVFYICVFYFPPLYANRSNAIGGEGRFFYVFLYFRQSLEFKRAALRS